MQSHSLFNKEVAGYSQSQTIAEQSSKGKISISTSFPSERNPEMLAIEKEADSVI